MTPTHHPGVDELADYAEGLLDPGVADAVERHLADCPACRQVLAGLAEVSAALAAAADPGPMPELVAARIDRALAAAATERSPEPAAVPSIRSSRERARLRRLLPGVLAAAAAVVGIGYVGMAGLGGPQVGGSAGTASDAGAPEAAAEQGADSGGGERVATPQAPTAVTPPDVSDEAALQRVASQAARGALGDPLHAANGGAGGDACRQETVAGAPGAVVASFRARHDGRDVVVVALRRPDGGGTALVLPQCGSPAGQALARAEVPPPSGR